VEAAPTLVNPLSGFLCRDGSVLRMGQGNLASNDFNALVMAD